MANFSMRGLEDLMEDIGLLDADRIAPQMLEEAAPILERNVKKRTEKHKDTSDMVNSIKQSKVTKDKDGYHIAVRPTGKDRKGVRNMEKACYLEFGTSRQDATPVISPAVRESEDAVLEKMQEVFNREVED